MSFEDPPFVERDPMRLRLRFPPALSARTLDAPSALRITLWFSPLNFLLSGKGWTRN
jgi:hypothetical protein